VRTRIEVDAHEAEAMLRRLADAARPYSRFYPALQSAAEQGASMISGVARDTGELAGSIQAGGREAPGLIVSDLDYARFVFGGTSRMEAQPPLVPEGAIATILADEVAELIFG
jgi:hypothetical protein